MESQPKFCMHCGRPLQIGQTFCASCGTKTDAQSTNITPSANVVNNGIQPIAQSQPTMQSMAQTVVPLDQPKKSKKKIWLGAGIAAAILMIVAIVLVIVLNIKGHDRTIMVYMVGSDLESEGAAASLDITEMKDANFDHEHTKVLVYTGGTKKWALDEISEEENAIFEVVDGQLNKVQTYPKKTMTEPGNIVDFVDFAYENYPADMYDLILWDHGGGPIYGYGLDENSVMSSPMKVTALAKALSETKLSLSGKKFDLIGFDACLMGSVEVAMTLSRYGDYMIASEEVEPGDGWNYSFLNDLSEENHVESTEELGKSIIDKYISFYNDDYSYDVDLSLSMVNLRKIDNLANATDDLFSDVKEGINAQTFSSYSQLMTRDKVYGYTGRDSESYDLVDLMDLCGSLKDNYGDRVEKIKTNFDDVIVYNQSNMESTNGLSVYFLNFNKAEAERMLVAYKDVAFSEKYYDFLMKYKNFVTGDRMVSRGLYKDLNVEESDGAIEIELPDELKDNYQSGEIIIYRKLGENRFMPVYRSSEVELADNKLRTTSLNLQFVIEADGPEGKTYGWTVMAEKERTESYADYVTYGVLWYDDGGLIGYAPKQYDMYVRLPKGDTEGQVRDIRVQSETDLASKMSFDPEKIKIIEFTVGSYRLFNDAGELDYNMESYRNEDGGIELYGISASLDEGDSYKIKLVGLDFDFGNMYEDIFNNLYDFYAEFIVHDTQGDTHRLNLIHIDN